MTNKRNHISSLAVAGVVVGLVLAACGDPDDQQGTAAGAQLPEVTLPEHPGWNLGYFDRGVIEQAQAQQGPRSQAAAIEQALEEFQATKEAKAEAVPTSPDFADAVAQAEAELELQERVDATVAETSDDTDTGRSVPDLRMR
jgi:hypothetical protein